MPRIGAPSIGDTIATRAARRKKRLLIFTTQPGECNEGLSQGWPGSPGAIPIMWGRHWNVLQRGGEGEG